MSAAAGGTKKKKKHLQDKKIKFRLLLECYSI